MGNELACVQQMQYPGRVVILGSSPSGSTVVMYAITGRSPSSQARRLEVDTTGKNISVQPTDEEVLRTGNPDLLVYPAILWGRGIAVSNGKQTEDVFGKLSENADPLEALVQGLAPWQYEPDEPNYTPRITGCVGKAAALSILKRASDGSVIRHFFSIPRIAGTGKMIATYTGCNENPLPSFCGEPCDLGVVWQDAQSAAEALYEALGPEGGAPDFRVAAAALYASADETITVYVKNRHN